MPSAARLFLPLLLVLTLLGGCQPKAQSENTRKLIENARQSGSPTLVEFGATTCRTCRDLKPVLETLAGQVQGRAHVIIVDLSKDYSLTGDFQVRVMPTLVFYGADGRETSRHMGAMAMAEMQRRLGLNSKVRVDG
jgi:thioredoxin 1